MAKVVTDVDDAITLLNTLLELDNDVPSEGSEDYSVWLSLLNAGINLWENEEGILWRELYVPLADAIDGDTSTDGTSSYTLPSDFVFPANGYVWLGGGTQKIPYKVIKREDVQLYEDGKGRWCYFTATTLEFNPNLTIVSGKTITYNYYKYATSVTTGTDTFEMSDPLFAVYYALSELTKEEGNQGSLTIATQKMEAMKTKNGMTTWFQDDNAMDGIGFGI